MWIYLMIISIFCHSCEIITANKRLKYYREVYLVDPSLQEYRAHQLTQNLVASCIMGMESIRPTVHHLPMQVPRPAAAARKEPSMLPSLISSYQQGYLFDTILFKNWESKELELFWHNFRTYLCHEMVSCWKLGQELKSVWTQNHFWLTCVHFDTLDSIKHYLPCMINGCDDDCVLK